MFVRIASLLLILCLFQVLEGRKDCVKSQTACKGSLAPKGQICSGDLIFEDNFDSFNTGKWRRENTLSGGGNGEFQWYTTSEENSFVRNGALRIRPTFLADKYGEDFLYSGTIDLGANCTETFSNGCSRTGTSSVILNPIQSGKLTTKDSFNFKYGVLEARARMPSGDWLWPTIWMMPIDSVYGDWPVSGEVDLAEARGNKHMFSGGVNIGSEQVTSTMHWGPNRDFNRFMMTHWEKNNGQGYDTDFHTYKLRWTPDTFEFFFDGAQIGSVTPPDGGFWQYGDLDQSGLQNPWPTKMAPFDQEFYIIINLAIGSSSGYFPDNLDYGNDPKPWTNNLETGVTAFWQGRQYWEPSWNRQDPNSKSHFEVDYVRVYAL